MEVLWPELLVAIPSSLFGLWLAHRFLESNFLKQVKRAAMEASLKVPFVPPASRKARK